MIIKMISIEQKRLPTKIDVVQNTNAVPLKFVLIDYDIPASAEVRIYVKKPSGLEVYNACEIEENSVIVRPTMQMYAEKGTARAQIQIIQDSTVAATFPIVLNIAENIISTSAIQSSNEFEVLDILINQGREFFRTLSAESIPLEKVSGMTAENVQEAVSELYKSIEEVEGVKGDTGPPGPPTMLFPAP